MVGSLDSVKQTVPKQVSRLEKITSNTGPAIKAELDPVLEEGWTLIDVFTKGSNTFAVFTRPKRQQ